ncbi:MAG: ATP-binding protein [Desulfurococcales archaeon]|nr:ATP-binding protein [Desulfurococcales archaeon]
MVKRIRLSFVPGIEVEFVDRDRAIQQVIEWSERSTRFPIVVYGPEGCGKTAWLRQTAEVLSERGYEVFYIHPLDRLVYADVSIPSVKEAFLEFAQKAFAEDALSRIVWALFDFVRDLLKVRKARVAIIADDVFQAIGLRYAAAYVKGLLNMIEYPQYSYERMVVIVATSEGVSKAEIGRHRWADLMPMWNMSREGFEQLYRQIPGPKPSFEEVWRITGGNPGMLAKLYKAKWSVDEVIKSITTSKDLDTFILSLSAEERKWLLEAVENPDTLPAKEKLPLMQKLIELNLIISSIIYRDPELWIDQPPPQKDLELGIGKHIAWQTPLHREAVRKALQEASTA